MRRLSRSRTSKCCAAAYRRWTDGYLLMPSHPRPIDYEMVNWWAATHPSAMLRKNLLVSRPVAGGGRLTLFNRRLSPRRPLDGAPQDLDAIMARLDALPLSPCAA